MMLCLIFLISFFTGNIHTATNLKTTANLLPSRTLPRNSSSQEFTLATILRGYPREKSQSPHSRSSSAARSINDDQFHTPNKSPIPIASTATPPIVPQTQSNHSLSDWDLAGEEENKRWQNVRNELHKIENRNGTITYLLKQHPKKSQRSKLQQFTNTVRDAAEEAAKVISLLPEMFEEWKNNAH